MDRTPPKKSNRIVRVLMTVLTVFLIFLFFDIMSLVADIQDTARVVNYAGLVRGTTQRIVKLEDAQQQQDRLIDAVDSYINGLRYGSEELNLVRLDDDAFQSKMEELNVYYATLTVEIAKVRKDGYESTNIIAMSETFFGICDEATKLAENYSQEKATALNHLESVVIADIVALIALMAFELARALRFAALNRALQKKVYLDEATGLPNKNKCEELLGNPAAISRDAPVALCMFDLNNLRTINNNLGHEKGDEYIRSFALQLQKSASESRFVGRQGGDEFIAIIQNATQEAVESCLDEIRSHTAEYSAEHPEMPISYAAGYALSSNFDECTMRDLFRQADKNMYLDKNRAKLAEEASRRQTDRRVLAYVEKRGYRFSDCLYCNALLDQYRTLLSSSRAFLAKEGNYSGAVEEIARTVFAPDAQFDGRKQLALGNVAHSLTEDGSALEIRYDNGNNRKGRLTLLRINSAQGALHHFVLGFEPFFEENLSEKERLSRYYDQMKQSIMDNGDYVDALLDSAQTAYSVDLTHDTLEKAFSQATSNRHDIGMDLPCSYSEYCRARTEYVTKETLQNYRLIDTSEKLLKRFESGVSQLTIEYQEYGVDGSPIWLQKIVLMSHDTAFDEATQTEMPVVRGIILFKDTSAFHEQEQKEMQQLEEALVAADAESKQKTEFMNRMSHDFRTPINGIMGMLEIIHQSNNDPAKTAECLDKIQVSADHLLDLVNDVLDMSKLDSGAYDLEEESFDIEKLMADVRAPIDAQIAESGLVHRSHRCDMVHTHLIGSPLRVRQIMLNLFSNAVKYNRENGEIDTYATEISFDGETALYEFKITDTGIGMSQEFIEQQLYKPFTQEQFDARTHYRGTGLGMSIVKALIDKMGGTIEVKSAKGHGTTFVYRLPFKVDASAEKQCEAKVPEEVSLSGKRILVVEDNDINMEIAEFYLASAGALVEKAWNGREAVDVFQAAPEGTYSLVLMDLMMPVMDGVEATKAIRALKRSDAQSTPIIAMTAKALEDDKQSCKKAGMNAYLVKPLDMQSLLSTCAKLSV